MLCQSMRVTLLDSYPYRKTEDLQRFDMEDLVESIHCQLISRAILVFPVHVMLTCARDQYCARTNDLVTHFRISNVEYLRR